MKHNHEGALRLASSRTKAIDVYDIAGRWVNSEGSFLDLKIDGHDLTGTYAHRTYNDGHHIATIKGFATGGILTMAAFYHSFGALSCWTGEVLGEPPDTLRLGWCAISEVEEPEREGKFWLSQYSGAEDFKRA